MTLAIIRIKSAGRQKTFAVCPVSNLSPYLGPGNVVMRAVTIVTFHPAYVLKMN